MTKEQMYVTIQNAKAILTGNFVSMEASKDDKDKAKQIEKDIFASKKSLEYRVVARNIKPKGLHIVQGIDVCIALKSISYKRLAALDVSVNVHVAIQQEPMPKKRVYKISKRTKKTKNKSK
jgi:hypothetical protein